MARKRMIDPKIWESEQVMSLPSDLFKMYIYFITNADDEGRFKISYPLLKSRIFPLNDFSTEVIENAIIYLHKIKLICLYTDGESLFLYHPHWKIYQKISHPTESILPSPEKCNVIPEDSLMIPEDSGGISESSRSITPQYNVVKFSIDKFSIDKDNGSPAARPPAPSRPSENSQKPKKPKQSGPDFSEDEISLLNQIIEDWNTVLAQARSPDTIQIRKLLRARFDEGYKNLEDYKLVHRWINAKWTGCQWKSADSKCSDFYKRPKTVYSEGKIDGFGEGFSEYLE